MLGLECSLVKYPGALQRAGIGHVAFAVRASDFHRRPVPGPGQFHVAGNAGAQNPSLRRSRHQFRYHAGRRRERAERIVEGNQAGKGDFVRTRPFEQRPPLAFVLRGNVAGFVVYRKGNVILAGYNRSAASAPPEGEKCGIYYVRCCHCVYFFMVCGEFLLGNLRNAGKCLFQVPLLHSHSRIGCRLQNRSRRLLQPRCPGSGLLQV